MPMKSETIYRNPLLASDYTIAVYTSSVRNVGEPVAGFVCDSRGWYRHLTAPCIGAYEYGIEATAADAAGRITNRTVAGRSYGYGYDAAGRLVSYGDSVDAANDAAYTYDHQGRRIRMVVGVEDHRCVYEGDDVSVEYVDGNGNGSLLDACDYTRKYWLLPEIDQRIGFMDIDSTGTKTRYYYLTDQVGSVLQIVTTNGTVVNQYDYDAFGNIRWENSFEGVANRYTFHGREWDAERGDYYYRNRTYVPEWGSFTGPDMYLGNGIEGEPEGVGNYVFCRNDPVNNLDPCGLQLKEKMDVKTLEMMTLREKEAWLDRVLTKEARIAIVMAAEANKVPDELVATIIVNELADIDWRDMLQQDLSRESGSLGIAQIQVDTAIEQKLLPGIKDKNIVAAALKDDTQAVKAAARLASLLIDTASANSQAAWQKQFGSPTGESLRDAKVTQDEAQMIMAAYNSPEIQIAKRPGSPWAGADEPYPRGRIHGQNAVDTLALIQKVKLLKEARELVEKEKAAARNKNNRNYPSGRTNR